MAVITTENLIKRYGDVTAVDSLDLEIQAGEIFGLLGPNGAGKTTTILMLLGLAEPTEGRVEVLGLDPRRDALAVKAATGYVPDAVGFYDNLTGRQNLRYTARLNGFPADRIDLRIDELLDLVGLSDAADRHVGGYSRGMKQRLGLADALVNDPQILILDEPTVNIDPEGVSELLTVIRRLADDGVTILLSSHLLYQVQSVCDRIGIFVAGRLAAVGSLEELAAELDDRYVIEVDATLSRDRLATLVRQLDGVTDVAEEPNLVVVSADADIRATIADAIHDAGAQAVHLRRRSAELDAVYHRYFHRAGEAKTQEVAK